MKRTKWTERKFNFDMPEDWLANVLERLHGTSARIAEMCKTVREEETEYKQMGKWSIKEHIGHLADLEDLHEGRIDDFIARKEILRAADMSNTKTEKANHNTTSLDELISNFSEKRHQFIHRLKKLDEETQCFKSLHTRLKTPMRPIDVAYFTAEHDDHHLASIREIIESMNIKKS